MPIVAFAGADPGDFTVTMQPATPVAGAGNTTFTVTFDATTTGLRTATVSIANSDADENPYTFAIAGMGIAPEIDVLGMGISIANGDTTPTVTDDTDFGDALADGGIVTNTFTVANSGGADLNLTGMPIVAVAGANPGDFTVTMQPATPVAGAGNTNFTVTFDPASPTTTPTRTPTPSPSRGWAQAPTIARRPLPTGS